MHPSRRWSVLALLLAAVAAQAESYKLSVYYEGPAAVARDVEKVFETFRGDVVTVIPFVAQTPAEMDAVAASADIVWGGGAPMHRRLLAAGRVMAYRSNELGSLDAAYWKATPTDAVSALECMVIAYDPTRMSAAAVPTRWRDLLDARWQGKLSMRDPSAGPDSVALASVMVRSLQWTFLESLAAQLPLVTSTNDDALAKLAAGDAQLAIVPYHAVTQARASLSVVWPTDGPITTPRPIAILEQSRRPAMMTGLAEQLVDFVLSGDGQAIGKRYGLYPTRADISPPPGAPQSAVPAGGEATWVETQSGDLRERLRRLFGN